MCAPQNPTGRVWTYDELLKVANIVNKYNGYIICDEIHSDIVWGRNVHVSPTQIPEIADRAIAVFSTSKTFNMGGFHVGTAIVPNANLRKKMVDAFYSIGHVCDRPAVMCLRAQTAAYTKGERWLDEMLSYVDKNFDYALKMFENTPIKATHPEGTFLLWCDISDLNWSAEKLRQVMYNEWKVLPDPGSYYDTKDWATYEGLEHHIRLNLALPRSVLIEAMDRITKYFK
jgi:cystathionine beta-lyase